MPYEVNSMPRVNFKHSPGGTGASWGNYFRVWYGMTRERVARESGAEMRREMHWSGT